MGQTQQAARGRDKEILNSSISKLEKERAEQTKKIQRLMKSQIGTATAVSKKTSKSRSGTRNKTG